MRRRNCICPVFHSNVAVKCPEMKWKKGSCPVFCSNMAVHSDQRQKGKGLLSRILQQYGCIVSNIDEKEKRYLSLIIQTHDPIVFIRQEGETKAVPYFTATRWYRVQ